MAGIEHIEGSHAKTKGRSGDQVDFGKLKIDNISVQVTMIQLTKENNLRRITYISGNN